MMMERWSLIPIIKNKYDNTFCDNGLYNNSRCDSTRGIETAVSSEKPLFYNKSWHGRCYPPPPWGGEGGSLFINSDGDYL